VRRHLERVRLDPPADRAVLERFVSARLGESLDLAHPLWKMYYVENFKSGAAVVVRIHHCIGDGMSLMQVLMNLADADVDPSAGPGPPPSRESRPGPWSMAWRGIGSLIGLAAMRADPPTPLRGALGPEKRVAWSPRIPLEEVQRVRARLGGTVNDVLVTALAGGLRDRLEARERGSSRPIRAVLPVNLRGGDDLAALGNRFGLVFLGLPLEIEDDAVRLAEVRTRMNRLKHSPQAWVVYRLLRLVGLLGPDVQGAVLRRLGRNATGVLTNVPGPREPLRFCGATIEDFMFWVPQSGDLGIGISILSYAGQVRFGVASDVRLEPEPSALVDATLARLAAMRDAAPS